MNSARLLLLGSPGMLEVREEEMARISSHTVGLCYVKLRFYVGIESCRFSPRVAWWQGRLSVPDPAKQQQQDTDSKQKL